MWRKKVTQSSTLDQAGDWTRDLLVGSQRCYQLCQPRAHLPSIKNIINIHIVSKGLNTQCNIASIGACVSVANYCRPHSFKIVDLSRTQFYLCVIAPGGSTPICWLYGYVLLYRVWFSTEPFCQQQGIGNTHFSSGTGCQIKASLE